jgi:hypothetical protein
MAANPSLPSFKFTIFPIGLFYLRQAPLLGHIPVRGIPGCVSPMVPLNQQWLEARRL